ncbi:MAG: histidine kinase dimerization/phosphoacceptor domain -containing protein [Flavobacteriales bacterium]
MHILKAINNHWLLLLFAIFYSSNSFGIESCQFSKYPELANQFSHYCDSIDADFPNLKAKTFETEYFTTYNKLSPEEVHHIKIEIGKKLSENQNVEFYAFARDLIINNNHPYCVHFEKVLEYYIIQVLVYEYSKDLTELIDLLNNKYLGVSDWIAQKYLASVYYKQGDYEMAIIHWKLSINLHKPNTIKNIQRISSLYNNIGVSYTRMGDNKNAKLSFQKAIRLWNSIEHKDLGSKHYQTYFSMVMEDNLLQLEPQTPTNLKIRFQNYLKLYEYGKMKNLPVFDYPLYTNLTSLAFDCGEYEKGYFFFHKLDSIVNEKPHRDLNKLFSFYSSKIKYHSLKGQQDEVFRTLNKLDSVKTAKFDWYKNILPQIGKLDSKYSNKLLVQTKEALVKERNTRYLLFSALCILIVLFAYTLNVNKKERKAREQINIQKDIIEFSLEKSKILIREIHHRVKNNLQFVNSIVYLEYIKNQNKFDVNSFERKIISLAQVHDMLYSSKNISQVNMKEYVCKLVKEIKIASANQFDFTLDLSEFVFGSDTAISFGLMYHSGGKSLAFRRRL